MSQCEVVNGPGKFDLIQSLFRGRLDHNAVMFDIMLLSEDKTQMPRLEKTRLGVKIKLIKREDGSGESWIFEGDINSWESKNSSVHNFFRAGHRKAKGYFRTDTRRGHISFE